MGAVYRATDTKLGRDVALKVLPAEMAASPERLERFRREAKALAALDHHGIVTVYSVEEAEGVHFLTMQLVEGQPLDRLIPEAGLPVERILEVATALTEALAAAHEKGIVHRDLKPGNVMLGEDGRVKVLDFGLAKIAGALAGEGSGSELPTDVQTREGVVVGTMPYMSPEQVSGRAMDHRTDIFSLGVILYEVSTGHRPFEGRSSAELTSAILRDAPSALEKSRPDLPTALREVIERCLEKDPARRPASAREVHDSLVAAGSGSGSEARTRLSSILSPRTAKLALAAGAILILVAVLLFGLGRLGPRAGKGAAAGSPEKGVGEAVESARSIAVLPFVNLSGDPEQEYFGDGIAEEVLNALAAVPGLRVAARTSAFSFKGKNLDVRTIAEQLGVAHVLEGSVRLSGKRLRITAQLVSAKDGYRVWSDAFDRELTDVFAVQEEIARSIVRALSAQLNAGSPNARLVQPGTSSLEAYNAYLRGRFRLGLYSREAIEQSIRDFQEAIAADPGFADAYGALALGYANLHVWVPFGEVEQPLKAAFEKGLELDPNQPGALVGKAWYTIRTVWDWRAAEALYLRAMEHSTRDVYALDFYAAVQLCPTGRTDEAVALYRKALETDPFNTLLGFDLAWVLMMAGRAGEARVEIDKVLVATPDYSWGLGLEAWALAESGNTERTRAAIERVPESDDEIVLMTLALAHDSLGDTADFTRLTARLRARAASSPVHRLDLGWVLALTGRVDEGLSEADRALELGAFQVPFSRPLLGRIPAVRENPRFRALLKKMKLDDVSLRQQGFLVGADGSSGGPAGGQ